MALFQPRDWFSAAQLSLSLAIRIVCQKMDECNLSKSISTMFHISMEEKLFLDSCCFSPILYIYKLLGNSYLHIKPTYSYNYEQFELVLVSLRKKKY